MYEEGIIVIRLYIYEDHRGGNNKLDEKLK